MNEREVTAICEGCNHAKYFPALGKTLCTNLELKPSICEEDLD